MSYENCGFEFSKLSEKCKNCEFVDNCNNKMLEAVLALPLPAISNSNSIVDNGVIESSIRETRVIKPNGKIQTVYVDEIEKEIYKHIYKDKFKNMGNCTNNKV